MTLLKLLLIFPVGLFVSFCIWGPHGPDVVRQWKIILPVMIGAAVYVIAQPGLRKRKSLASRKVIDNRKEESLLQMVNEQEALESAERERKARNPVLSVAEYLTNPARFPEVVKYKLKFVDLGGVYYTKEDVQSAVFFTENRFFAEAKVIHVQYSTMWIYRFSNFYSKGYVLNGDNGFQVLVEVVVGGIARRLYVNIFHDFQPKAVAAETGGYKVAKESSPWDVFGGRMGAGAKIRVEGDLYKRVSDLYVKTETADNRWIQPAGLYLVCEPKDVVFL
jgi:hypothetical protein